MLARTTALLFKWISVGVLDHAFVVGVFALA
jgi:hypothetical protein